MNPGLLFSGKVEGATLRSSANVQSLHLFSERNDEPLPFEVSPSGAHIIDDGLAKQQDDDYWDRFLM
jgi:hypothetical protein